jgi:ribonuclease P protein component
LKKFGLSKNERIKSKKEFELVYKSGEKVLSARKLLKAHFYSESSDDFNFVKVAFGINKKSGKAFWRNRLRRILRDCYRLNKSGIVKLAELKNKKLLIIFSPYNLDQKTCSRPTFGQFESDFIDLLNKIEREV